MRREVELRELTVTIVAKNHNPSILNPDFLRLNHIVSEEWELAEPPVNVELIAQVKYKNGIGIAAQLDKITFFERVGGTTIHELRLPQIAKSYVGTLPHVDYRAVGINPKGLVIADSDDEARHFVAERLIADGPWKSFGDRPPVVKADFVYSIGEATLNLAVGSGTSSEGPEATGISNVVFAGNFHREIGGENPSERMRNLLGIIDIWKEDIEAFTQLVNSHFLK